MAGEDESRVTLLQAGAPSRSGERATSWTLPQDLREEAARRVGAVALLYAAVYLLVGVLPLIITPEGRALFFGRTIDWLPATSWIADALLIAGWSAARASLPR